MKFETRCVIVSRKPREGDNEFKTVSLALFDENDAHKLGIPPKKSIDFPNIETAHIVGLNVSYYSEGNDLLINNLISLSIEEQSESLIIAGNQKK